MEKQQLPPGRIPAFDNRFYLRDAMCLQNWVFKILSTKFPKSKEEQKHLIMNSELITVTRS